MYYIEFERISEIYETRKPSEILCAKEQEYFASLKFDKRKKDYLVGRYTAKKLLLENFVKNAKLSFKDISILKDEDGKPDLYINGEKSNIMLSISHSGDFASAIASTKLKFLGVDTEKIETRSESWAKQSFYNTEYPTNPQNQTDEFFTTLWAKKEAVVKALGVGLSVDLWDIRFENGQLNFYNKTLEIWKSKGSPELKVEVLTQPNGYITVICGV
ncbi:MAG: 4'-phosphopantetheinyl transferase superfamily protein [Elusimicrobiaceae bacterium]|jgi:4'-phosphopantetheinyl transferase|nr:4'-phosphopantetheinyl transferase superfamily protein [Elusimicrobiaceae bacterium]MBT3955361.1 4'-phosphopantetheinyl transferase superfamily protein [Elusimicrobiaceae bacterium]MBT4008497.1 4'-phosphopantetheinyl transferase superfamily protein [Elusimicrobiaceae bacterium]MBT4403385.1 4'-phosphopantetheinyl transferase superfamily protein [Elusimicrobiaceae bacterium]MBT4440226.1 4'-phosphopantetheinyl transferase superfamily protein [Elusimicrobiaceae bacterium]